MLTQYRFLYRNWYHVHVLLVDTRVLVDEKNNTVKIIIFDSQESRQNRVQKKQILNIQEFRPGRSAMQGHCGLRLFFKKHAVWVTVQCST